MISQFSSSMMKTRKMRTGFSCWAAVINPGCYSSATVKKNQATLFGSYQLAKQQQKSVGSMKVKHYEKRV